MKHRRGDPVVARAIRTARDEADYGRNGQSGVGPKLPPPDHERRIAELAAKVATEMARRQ